MKKPFWGPKEIEILDSLAGDMPLHMLITTYQNTAAQYKLPKRNPYAIYQKLKHLKIKWRSTGEWITPNEVAIMMGVDWKTVKRLIDNKKLTVKRFIDAPHTQCYVSRTDLRKLARKHPEIFGGMAEVDLVQLLDSEHCAAKIAAMALPKRKQKKRVICIETGEVFESISAAARAAFVVRQGIQRAITHGGAANGRHYAWAPQEAT
jgi:hypothetical protein